MWLYTVWVRGPGRYFLSLSVSTVYRCLSMGVAMDSDVGNISRIKTAPQIQGHHILKIAFQNVVPLNLWGRLWPNCLNTPK